MCAPACKGGGREPRAGQAYARARAPMKAPKYHPPFSSFSVAQNLKPERFSTT